MVFPHCPLPFDERNPFNTTHLKASLADPITHTQQPIVTGSSVLAVKFKDGVVMVADSLASYGSLARFRDEQRIFALEDSACLVGGSGDMGDFQYVKHQLEALTISDSISNDANQLTPNSIYQYLGQVMYQRRSKNDPLWNSFIVGGVDVRTGEVVLGCANLHGTTWQSDCLATGFGSYLAQPIMRKLYEKYPGTDKPSQGQFRGYKDVTKEQAIQILEQCLRVLWCRDARSSKRYFRGVCELVSGKAQTKVEGPFEVEAEWSFAEGVKGYGRN